MKIAPCLMIFLTSAAFGQSGGPSRPSAGTSRSDFAAQSIFDRLSKEVARRSGHPDDAGAIGRAKLRVVFLLDSSQNSSKDFLPLFEKKVVAGVLRRLGLAQVAANAPDESLDLVSIRSYQFHVIDDPKWSATDQLLKRGKGAVETIIDRIPPQRVGVTGEPALGHDSTGSRAELIHQLGAEADDRENVVIQMSPTSVNSDPSNPANNKTLVQEDARAGGVAGTPFQVYDDDGRYYQTDAPGNGVNASDVHIWIYGPEKFVVPAAAASPPTQNSASQSQAADQPPQEQGGVPTGLLIVGLLLLGGVGYIAYRFLVTFPVEMEGEIGKVGFSKPVSVIVVGGKTGHNSLLVSPQKRGSVGEGLKIAELALPLLFGGPKLSGAGGHTMYVLNSSTPSLALTKRPVAVAFGKGDTRTETLQFKLK